MFGSIVIRRGRHFLAVAANDHLGIIAPGGCRIVAVHVRKIVNQKRNKPHDLFGESTIISDEPNR